MSKRMTNIVAYLSIVGVIIAFLFGSRHESRFHILSLFLVFALCIGVMPAAALAADTVGSGTCGENLTWVLDSDGVLTISGTGPMTNYSSSSVAPWYSSRTSIISVEIESGVTSIGNYAFYGCTNLTSVSIPDGVTTIGNYASASIEGIEYYEDRKLDKTAILRYATCQYRLIRVISILSLYYKRIL